MYCQVHQKLEFSSALNAAYITQLQFKKLLKPPSPFRLTFADRYEYVGLKESVTSKDPTTYIQTVDKVRYWYHSSHLNHL